VHVVFCSLVGYVYTTRFVIAQTTAVQMHRVHSVFGYTSEN
jgi:hypothetical protein